MDKIKLLILITQVGRIWSKHRKEIKVFQTLTTVGFFLLYFQQRKDSLESMEQREFDNKI